MLDIYKVENQVGMDSLCRIIHEVKLTAVVKHSRYNQILP